MSVIIFLIVLVVLVLVHEFGHFIVAKWAGMRVDEFGIGFPPRLASMRRGETLYSLNALPIGGFVRIHGENPDEVAADDGDRAQRSFSARPRYLQALVLLAGVAMNILLAWLLFAVVMMMGVPTAVSEADATSGATLAITNVMNDSPAEAAGITAGAEIAGLRAGDDTLEGTLTPSTFQSFIQAHAGDAIEISFTQNGETKTATLTPKADLLENAPDQAAIGVGLSLVDTVRTPFPNALWESGAMTVNMLVAITVGIGTLLADAVTLQADLSNVAGPVGIAGLVGDAASFGFTSLLMFTAFISLNLAVINLLPFPALDGGRLVFVAIEAIKGSPLKPSFVGAANALGFLLLMFLIVAVTINDIARL